jgi:hypothetical protein
MNLKLNVLFMYLRFYKPLEFPLRKHTWLLAHLAPAGCMDGHPFRFDGRSSLNITDVYDWANKKKRFTTV